jgi:hypothetical protein
MARARRAYRIIESFKDYSGLDRGIVLKKVESRE